MSDRYKALTVALDTDLRDEDARPIIEAIRQLRGVTDVTPIVADAADWIARQRVRHALAKDVQALWDRLVRSSE